MTIRRLLRLAEEERGATIIEFAMILPVMLLLIMGLGELCYQCYVQAVLTGAVQKAGRDSGIEGGAANTSTIDAAVQAQVLKIAGSATFASTRTSYSSFAKVAQPEPFTDSNGNGIHDPKECFQDVNGNRQWDSDQGLANSQGGASDVTVYTMAVTYPHLFPLSRWIGWSDKQTLSATTTLQNQPYKSQSVTTPTTICPT
jgi:Flp pilus assembly protein TadG